MYGNLATAANLEQLDVKGKNRALLRSHRDLTLEVDWLASFSPLFKVQIWTKVLIYITNNSFQTIYYKSNESHLIDELIMTYE